MITRNDVLDAITKAIYGGLITDEKMYVAGEAVLKVIEDMGMIPPAIEVGDSGFVPVVDLLDYTELDYEIKWPLTEDDMDVPDDWF